MDPTRYITVYLSLCELSKYNKFQIDFLLLLPLLLLLFEDQGILSLGNNILIYIFYTLDVLRQSRCFIPWMEANIYTLDVDFLSPI